MADMADIAGTGQPRSEFVETKVVYSPAWRKIGEKAGYRDRELEGKEVETARLAVQRLLLQIVVVVVLAGGLAAVIGSKEQFCKRFLLIRRSFYALPERRCCGGSSARAGKVP